MLFQDASISITYKRIEGVKKAFYLNEEKLHSIFNEAVALPVPDEAPDDVPRIVAKTRNEHGQLRIMPTRATFSVKFDDGFEYDWDSCIGYIREKMGVVFDFLNILTDNDYCYTGFIVNVLRDDVQSEGSKILANNLLKISDVDKIYDFNIRYTFVEDDRIFINILLQNARLFNVSVSPEVAGELSSKNQTAESIGAIIDINDRYGFNNCDTYHSDSSQLEILMEKMSNVINSKLDNLINGGIY